MAKKPLDDDGRTIADMNVEGFSWHLESDKKKNKKEIKKLHLSKKEKRAIVRGSYLAMLPMFLIFIGSFTVVFLLLWFWLK